MENPIKMDDLGGPPLFLETPIYKFGLEPPKKINDMFPETNRQIAKGKGKSLRLEVIFS